jgi:predicted acylesterase/phospholipase RssA
MSAEPHVPSGAAPEGETEPRRSLVLAGGGMRVAYQAGAIRALVDAGLVFFHADGTSGGTINLAMLLSGLTPPEMCDRWRRLNVRDFVSFAPLADYVRATQLMALGDADGIVGHVFPDLGIDVDRIRSARGLQGTFNVCNYTTKTNEAIDHTDIDLDMLVAGISLPIFMPPVRRGDAMYVDSVWIRDANLWEAVRRGAEEIWLVWCIGNEPEYHPGPFRQYVHMIELSANGALFEDLDRIRELNGRIENGEGAFGQTRPIRLHVVKPASPLPLDPDFYEGRIDADTLISMGYRDARRYLASAAEEGLPLTPDVTRMAGGRRGVMFSETLTGPFALGATDPVEGAARGRTDGTTLALRANADVDDVERFVLDPDHTASLTGDVSFPAFGDRLPCVDGLFNLFAPSDEPDAKMVVYELGFEHGGRSYRVAGRAHLRDDPGADAWGDITTIPATLHEGDDASGPVAGAGVLRLDVGDVARLVSSIHATNTDSVAERAATVARFGSWYLGQLWDSYHGV